MHAEVFDLYSATSSQTDHLTEELIILKEEPVLNINYH